MIVSKVVEEDEGEIMSIELSYLQTSVSIHNLLHGYLTYRVPHCRRMFPVLLNLLLIFTLHRTASFMLSTLRLAFTATYSVPACRRKIACQHCSKGWMIKGWSARQKAWPNQLKGLVQV